MGSAWLVGGVRTPFGKFCGSLSDVPLLDLAAHASSGALGSVGWRGEDLSELIAGVAMIEGGLMVPARQLAVLSGLPETLATLTVDRACCSGMTTVGLALRSIAAGSSSVLCIGMESMSRTPRLLHETRTGKRRGDLVVEDLVLLRSPLSGGTAIAAYAGREALDRGVGREDQDQWAYQSHTRYFDALHSGYFDDEVLPIETPRGRVSVDEQPRENVSLEALAKLPTVYDSPTVTAGNAPGLNDGACALVLSGAEMVGRAEQAPLAEVVAYRQIASKPTSAVYLPGIAIRQILSDHDLKPQDVDVFEINEAYAATAVVSIRELASGDPGLEAELRQRTNVHGGAVAIGHPTGASGARLVLTAARQLRRSGTWAVAAICGGFGQTDVVLLRRP